MKRVNVYAKIWLGYKDPVVYGYFHLSLLLHDDTHQCLLQLGFGSARILAPISFRRGHPFCVRCFPRMTIQACDFRNRRSGRSPLEPRWAMAWADVGSVSECSTTGDEDLSYGHRSS